MITGNPIQHSLWGHFCQLNQEQKVPTTHPYNTAPSEATIKGLEKQAALGEQICRLTSFLTLAAKVARYATPVLAVLSLIVTVRGKALSKTLGTRATLFSLMTATQIIDILFDRTTGVFKKQILLLRDNTERAQEQLKTTRCVQRLISSNNQLSPREAHYQRVDKDLQLWESYHAERQRENASTSLIVKNRIALLKVEKAFIKALEHASSDASLRITTTTHPLSLSDERELCRKAPDLVDLSERFIRELDLKVTDISKINSRRTQNDLLTQLQKRGEGLDQRFMPDPKPELLNPSMLYPDSSFAIKEDALIQALLQSHLFKDAPQPR